MRKFDDIETDWIVMRYQIEVCATLYIGIIQRVLTALINVFLRSNRNAPSVKLEPLDYWPYKFLCCCGASDYFS